ncbi:MAG: biopolymer transporter ExbD [Bacteroidetes bacterium]|nr:biopolymer transporter ExbD [Bacteroidota bacterium]
MAAVDTGAPRSDQKGKKKKKRRLSIHIDMTPMVDVIMLLLTFFMLTTVFSRPQAMELNLPPDFKTKVEVAESALLTLRVTNDFKIYWSMGSDPKLQRIEFSDLRRFLIERKNANPKLITLIKIDRDATYNNMVDLIDEVNLAEINRFSLAPMTADDKKLLAKVAG